MYVMLLPPNLLTFSMQQKKEESFINTKPTENLNKIKNIWTKTTQIFEENENIDLLVAREKAN
jgi:hypothetical protein